MFDDEEDEADTSSATNAMKVQSVTHRRSLGWIIDGWRKNEEVPLNMLMCNT